MCNDVLLFDDTGELLPDGQVVAPHRGPARMPAFSSRTLPATARDSAPSTSVEGTRGQERAHTSRVHNYLLGGKTNYLVDRAAGDAVSAAFGSISLAVLAGQTYAHRVARHLARQGARQFIELGVGLPLQPHLHDTVQAAATADTSTLYIDNDPIALAYADTLLTDLTTGRSHVMEADVRDPEGLLAAVREHGSIDLDRPVVLLAHALLDFIPDDEDPCGVVAGMLRGIPPGSYFSLTHSAADLAPQAWAAAADAYGRHGIALHPRTGEKVERFLTGLDPVGPRLTTAHRWHPGSGRTPGSVTEQQAPLYAGAGRTP
ncbi:DUF5999 family protein [Streptomyces sp. NPDC006267]|uniref:DUF5999 family protein n=1 Tax=Streptomyces sp. NPDC006267 TaxID=3157173 RepID=UPI0033A7CA42